jgi:dipeptidyl aminopeptidase/acylaminoacyl peptidase
MKIMTALRMNLVWMLIFLIFPIQSIASGAQSLPATAFSTLPRIDDVLISPDGKKIIYLQNIENKTALVSFDLETGKMTTVYVADNEKFTFRRVEWANNDTVLFSVRVPYYRSGVPSYETRLLARKADGSEEAKELVKPSAQYMGGTVDLVAQFQDNIISLLPDDPEHILVSIALERSGRGLPSVYEVNVDTKKRRRIHRYKDLVRDWMVDQQGRIRVGQKLFENDGSTSTIIYNLANEKWVETWKHEVFSKTPITPMGFGKDPNILYVRAVHNDRDAIFKVDVSKADLPMELIAKDDKYDIEGSLIYSRKTRDVVGVYHGEAKGDRIYWNKDFKEFQAAIDKAFPDTVNYLISFSEDERRYVVYRTNSTTPGIYYLGDRDHNTMSPIAHTYPQLEGKLQGSKKILYTARDGSKIEAYLMLPGNHDPKVPGPAVIFPHGGPMVRDYGGFDYWAEFFASKGMIVLQPNFRGSSGYGREFELEALENMGLTMQDDLTDAANWLVERKLADPEHLAIVGASYGGYAALMGAVKTPDLFKCAVSFAGISDLIELRDSRIYYVGYAVVREQLGKDNEKLEAVSPIRFVDKIKIPILLVHGDEDRTVFVEQSRKMANELKNKNKIYTYIELEHGDHNLSLQKNRHKLFSAMDEFLDDYFLK